MSNFVDYDLVFNTMNRKNPNVNPLSLVGLDGSLKTVYAECNTINFNGYRQSGKTDWACKFANANPNCALIIPDPLMRKVIATKGIVSSDQLSLNLEFLVRDFNIIIIDDASTSLGEHLYKCLLNELNTHYYKPDLVIVLLG